MSTFASAARGLSFNVTTLFVNTAAPELCALKGVSDVLQGGTFPPATPVALIPPPPLPACSDGVDNDGDSFVDLADPGCSGSTENTSEKQSPSPPPPPPAPGQGLTFSIDGRLWFVSGATIRQALPTNPLAPQPYPTSAALVSSGLTTPVGVATNTCGNLLVADQGLKTIRRYNGNGAFQNNYLNFNQISALNKHFPRHLEIDASNWTYVLADSTFNNKNALVVRAGPAQSGDDPTGSCVSTSEIEILATSIRPSFRVCSRIEPWALRWGRLITKSRRRSRYQNQGAARNSISGITR